MRDKMVVCSLEDLPVVLRVEDLMPILGVGRSAAYNLVRSGQVRSVKIGHQFRIPKEAIQEFLTKASA